MQGDGSVGAELPPRPASSMDEVERGGRMTGPGGLGAIEVRDGTVSRLPHRTDRLAGSRRGRIDLLTIAFAVVFVIALSVSVPQFLEPRNLLNVAEQLSILGFMAIGMTFVMVTGGIDLSCYTVVSAAAVVGATAMVGGYPPVL